MPTFGLVMLIGNLAFVSPKTVRKVFDPIARRLSLAVVGKATRAGGRLTTRVSPELGLRAECTGQPRSDVTRVVRPHRRKLILNQRH